jgi:hypothetical protein
MNSFYSILYAGINPASGDKLAVGLFMHGGDSGRASPGASIGLRWFAT